MSATDVAILNKQRSLLLDKLQAFETSNRALRHILREHARRAVSSFSDTNTYHQRKKGSVIFRAILRKLVRIEKWKF